VAHADFSLGGGILADTTGSSVGTPTYVGSTALGPIVSSTLSESTMFDIVVGGTSPGGGIVTTLSIANNGSYEVGNGYANASALYSVNSITLTPDGGGASAVTGNGPDAWAITSAGTYQATINWTLSGTYNSFPNYLSEFLTSYEANLNVLPPIAPTSSELLNAYISAVPEPSQAIAGITLLGCGGLVFLGRRFVMKKA
jgi:hypothetical protein